MTPLLDALRARAARDNLRLHMPGHAGHAVIDGWEAVYALDLTELSDTGNLYADQSDGPIRAAERLYAECYHAGDCLFLTGGATQGILAMLSAFAAPGDTVVLDRNCHISVHNALALLDLRPVWIQALLIEPFHVTAGLTADALADALAAHPDAACVLITSPTYYGVLSDLQALAAASATRGVPLLVDAAHGAHLPFLPGHASPVAQGAAAAVLSAHKTMPALGQSAFLLTGEDTSAPLLRRRAALYGSSSPSYPLMASLDAARAYMEAGGREALHKVARAAGAIRQLSPHFLRCTMYIVHRTLSVDPLRLCLFTGSGHSVAARLEKDCGIICEMADRHNVIFLLSALHTENDLARLEAALSDVIRGIPAPCGVTLSAPPSLPRQQLTPRQALFGRQTALPWREALGRIAAEPIGPYPPGVPLAARGEVMDESVMSALERAGFEGEVWVNA